MVQQRKTQTKKVIKQVFSQLLKEKGFDALTVSDIARRSEINRGTFYLHYIDKYDLLKKLEAETVADLSKILLEDDENDSIDDPLEIIPYRSILQALFYVQKEFDFIQALVSPCGDPQFADKFKKILEQLLQKKVGESHSLTFSLQNVPADYATEILLSSTISIILLWIKKGASESPKEIAEMITKARELPPYKLLF
ncbi:AcrR family transcriptional regulator [Enterococcus sp. PF1-24]|uniref:TetR/AcrR family transcriptional regulator n=1 Tax=unclassified Enterococcus TaxID=2608891 RepID=UPI0024745D4D|nr:MULTISPECIES: TetR/AcrR family transcriptional regulator [unclassified Enterococcus]MDH6364859.1 AcrR family transcriptional regulator [Enterococcus sp. PFB1-1]MDH6401917.1 AcrR family transcriptional regulator [Enterococcus sp. PF1-24]